MLNPFVLSSSAKNLAAEAPVIPEPTITTSASDGSLSVVRWPSRNFEGSLCQNEAVDSGVGRLDISCLNLVYRHHEGQLLITWLSLQQAVSEV